MIIQGSSLDRMNLSFSQPSCVAQRHGTWQSPTTRKWKQHITDGKKSSEL